MFVRQFFRLNQARLDKTWNKGACGERVDDVDALATQGLTERLLQQAVNAVDDEADHLDWCV